MTRKNSPGILANCWTFSRRGGADYFFVCTFAHCIFPLSAARHEDFDMASYGIVKMLEGGHGQLYPYMPWEPNVAFTVLGEYNSQHMREVDAV